MLEEVEEDEEGVEIDGGDADSGAVYLKGPAAARFEEFGLGRVEDVVDPAPEASVDGAVKFDFDVTDHASEVKLVSAFGICRVRYGGEDRFGGFVVFRPDYEVDVPRHPALGFAVALCHGLTFDQYGRYVGFVEKGYNLGYESVDCGVALFDGDKAGHQS